MIPKPDHVHVLTHVEAEEATCTEDGNIEYWVCDKGDYPCGRFFEDEEATPESEIDQADTVIAATGHTPKDPVQENIAEPTCEHAGSYDEVVYCNVCGAELSRVTIETPTKPHEYGDAVYTWSGDNGKATATRTCGECGDEESETVDTVAQVTKEPTATERGETTYTAVFTKDGFTTQTKTVADIEPLTYRVTSGDGQTWTKGSGASASFTFKRSYKDALAFGKFTGILVDGESVAESDYTAQSGSVIVELAPAYLETLAKGGHTLAATFEDGSADASFTVVEKESGGSGGDQGDGSGGSGLPFSGDRSPLPLCALLMLLAGVVAVSWALRKEHAA